MVGKMITLYCRNNHGKGGEPCLSCGELLQYAMKRLESCRFQNDKPTCSKCPIHCYKPGKRESIKTVMRYSGRRMLLRNPIAIILHAIDGLRKKPDLSKYRTSKTSSG
ncbi:MAG: nitrous oxide-stimulated promoter family protein [Nitrospirae bacterium]|nr:nitrous oxide-stimulated promoter family protein [Nitrospirota bacterium]